MVSTIYKNIKTSSENSRRRPGKGVNKDANRKTEIREKGESVMKIAKEVNEDMRV